LPTRDGAEKALTYKTQSHCGYSDFAAWEGESASAVATTMRWSGSYGIGRVCGAGYIGPTSGWCIR